MELDVGVSMAMGRHGSEPAEGVLREQDVLAPLL
jgi:hypothetical protein